MGVMIGVGLFGSACHHRVAPAPESRPAAVVAPAAPAVPRPPAAPPRAVAAPAPPATRGSAPLSEAELFQRKSLAELNAERPLTDVFFDYDKDDLRDDARTALQRDAAWLSKWPGTRLLVEGHCDERGTAEYNLALGDRRAVVVKQYLSSLGVLPDRVQVRSLGKEVPFCQGTTESCWSQNRRGHFVITAK
jgi:peptidoglycan-associated lipoprotein